MKSGVSAALVMLALSSTAHAAEYPACSESPSSSDVEAAKGMHKAAEQYYAKARYDRAVTSWLDAYNFDCTAHRLLINIGNAYEKLGETQKAITAFDTYIARTGKAAERNIVDKVANMKALLAKAQQPATMPTSPEPEQTPMTEPSRPVESGGWSFASPGLAPWIMVGSGAVLGVTGGILLGVGVSKVDSAFDDCNGGTAGCTQEVADAGNLGRTLQVAGGAMIAGGAMTIAGGVIWHVLTSPSDESSDSGALKARRPYRIDVQTSPSFTGLSLNYVF